MSMPTALQMVAALLFALALIHTFSTQFFEHLAHTRPAHARVWHLLAEVEIVFGVCAMVFVVVMGLMSGFGAATQCLDSRNFTEPLFVFVIMAVTASKPVLQVSSMAVRELVRVLPFKPSMTFFIVVLGVVPLLGSFITEPAAMTLASLVDGLTPEFKYVVLTGAVRGGCLTIIANAPNPAGAAILKSTFYEGAISPLSLFWLHWGPRWSLCCASGSCLREWIDF